MTKKFNGFNLLSSKRVCDMLVDHVHHVFRILTINIPRCKNYIKRYIEYNSFVYLKNDQVPLASVNHLKQKSSKQNFSQPNLIIEKKTQTIITNKTKSKMRTKSIRSTN